MTLNGIPIIPNPSPNFTPGRMGLRASHIVNHITDGLFPGCLVWLCNPTSSASSHYLITRSGLIYQLVQLENSAWTNGTVRSPTCATLPPGVWGNAYTVTIEHEGKPGEPFPATQVEATIALQSWLCETLRIPKSREYIIGHSDMDSVGKPGCPGNKFPWDIVMAGIRGTEHLPEPPPKHWAQGALDDLVAAGLIASPDAWVDFDHPVSKAQMLSLINKFRLMMLG